MIKKFVFVLVALCSVSSFAVCPMASATDDVTFCSTFKTAAVCNCIANGMPSSRCQDMERVYALMLARFGTLELACTRGQQQIDAQTCIDNWNCYRHGGKDSQGRLCSSTQLACQ